MKRLFFSMLFITTWALAANAQAPYWVKHVPSAKNGNFYYRVTVAEGNDYLDAYSQAFAMAVYESYSKLRGIAVDINSSQQSIKESVAEAVSSPQCEQMRLPINKVCDYSERALTSGKLRLYVLWQVANSALEDPKFEDFNKCE